MKLQLIKTLNIVELNKIVELLGLQYYLYHAKTRTLIYSESVLEDIANSCTIGNIVNALFVNTLNKNIKLSKGGYNQEFHVTKDETNGWTVSRSNLDEALLHGLIRIVKEEEDNV